MTSVYKKEVWNEYAMNFLAVTPSKMLELNKAVASLAYGEVCDFGCGAAKIAPFVLDNAKVTGYTGIDSSTEMVKLARWHLMHFPEKPSQVIQEYLEVINKANIYQKEDGFDFGLSINSYYAWDQPEAILTRIYHTLKSNGRFVLVTPNQQLDMEAMLPEARRELVANPYFEGFVDQNRSISENNKAHLVDMDMLVEQVRGVGFKIVEVNQQFYDRGLNFLVLSH